MADNTGLQPKNCVGFFFDWVSYSFLLIETFQNLKKKNLNKFLKVRLRLFSLIKRLTPHVFQMKIVSDGGKLG